MPQNKVIDRIEAADTFDELKRHQFIIDAVMMILDSGETENDIDKIYYLMSVYQEKMKDFLPRFEKIINV